MLPIFFGEPQQVLLGHLKHFFFFFPLHLVVQIWADSEPLASGWDPRRTAVPRAWMKTTSVDQKPHVNSLYLQAANTLAITESIMLLSKWNLLFFFKYFLSTVHFCWSGNPITVHRFMFFIFELHCYLLKSRNPDTSHQVIFTHVPTEKKITFFPLIFVCCIRTFRYSPSVYHAQHLWVSLCQ